MSKAKKKSKRTFSGAKSKDMWDAIAKTKQPENAVFWALYLMGCRCQELEERLEERVRALEAQRGEG